MGALRLDESRRTLVHTSFVAKHYKERQAGSETSGYVVNRRFSKLGARLAVVSVFNYLRVEEANMDEATLVRFGADRIESRQIDELVGLARGLVADGVLNQPEVEFLQKWLVANGSTVDHPILRILYSRVREILADGVAEHDELSDYSRR